MRTREEKRETVTESRQREREEGREIVHGREKTWEGERWRERDRDRDRQRDVERDGENATSREEGCEMRIFKS